MDTSLPKKYGNEIIVKASRKFPARYIYTLTTRRRGELFFGEAGTGILGFCASEVRGTEKNKLDTSPKGIDKQRLTPAKGIDKQRLKSPGLTKNRPHAPQSTSSRPGKTEVFGDQVGSQR